MDMRTINAGNVSFSCPLTWEVEKADTLNNPDCIATLSKGQNNLINVVMFPTGTNLDDFKLFMENTIREDGGDIFSSDLVEIAGKNAIKLYAAMNAQDIKFDIHTYVFIEQKNIYIFELRTVDVLEEPVTEFNKMIESFKIN